MARKSKEAMREKENRSILNRVCMYNTVGYTRLSGEDVRHTNNVNTLKDQKLIVSEYIEHQDDMLLCDMFSDNGVSGMNFNRPGFEAMIKGIKEGKYNCVVVKDLSRFGRNHIETTYYLYKFFPEHSVRFIAINDGYDSLYPDKVHEDIILPIKNLINENYAREVSRKVSISKRNNIEKGLFVQKYTPFGYKKSETKRGKLAVDETVAPTVKRIFNAFVNKDMSVISIARALNDAEVISPAKYKYDLGIAKCKSWENAVWSAETVRNILRNQVYIGSMVLGKSRTEMYKNEKTKMLERDKWTVIPDSHEAIISTELFNRAQEKLKSKSTGSVKKKHDVNYIFNNLYCGCCGLKLAKKYELNKSGNVSTILYYCPANVKGKQTGCSFKRIYQNRLKNIVFTSLRNYILSVDDIYEICCKAKQVKLNEIENSIKKYMYELDTLKSLQTKTFDEWMNGSIDDKEYKMILDSYISKSKQCNVFLSEATQNKKEMKRQLKKCKEWIDRLGSYKDEVELTKEMSDVFIDRIVFYNQKSLEIFFKFRDVFEDAQMAEKSGGITIG